jgi:hypothetical protein
VAFLAVLNSRRHLAELVRSGNVPAAVATRTHAVARAARAAGVPVVLADALLTGDERSRIQDHVDDLVRALAGDEVPSHDDYAVWGWWALEWTLALAFSHGERTRRLLRAGLELAPRARSVVHDGEGYVQGAVVNLAAREAGVEPLGLAPLLSDAMHPPQDVLVCPLVAEQVRGRWSGRPLQPDPRPTVVLFHTNEIAQAFGDLGSVGGRCFRLAMDARDPWRGASDAGLHPPVVDAEIDPSEPPAPLVAPRWPAGAGAEAAPWEVEIAEHLFVTWQPFLRETLAWATAAYAAAGVRALLGANDQLPHQRCRLLACRAVGATSLLLQHGTFSMHRRGGRGDRNHAFADHSLVWSRQVARDLARWGCRRDVRVVGWPQGAQAAARPPHSLREGRQAERPWIVLTTTPHADNAEVAYTQGERFLRDVLDTIRLVAPGAPVVIKCHPRENRDAALEYCREIGHGDVSPANGDLWSVLAGAAGVVAAKSTAAFAAIALDVPVVVYHPSWDEAWFDRFADLPVARSPAELRAALDGSWSARGKECVRSHARADVHAGARIVAAVRTCIAATVAPVAPPSSPGRVGRYSRTGRGAMTSPVGTVPGVGAVRTGSGALPDSTGPRQGSAPPAARDQDPAAAAPVADVVDVSRGSDSLDAVALVGQHKPPELQLNPKRLLALMSRKT